MEDIGHQLLEAHVLHAGHALGAREVLVGRVAAHLALARVVDQELGHLAERPAFLARVGDEADAAALRAADALLDGMREIGPAGADVGAEDVGAVALVVDSGRELDLGVGQVARVAEDVERLAADGREEDLEVGAGHELGVHAARFLEEHAAQVGLGAAEAAGHFGQVPHWLDRGLGNDGRAAGREELAVGHQPPFCSPSMTSGRITCALVIAMVGRMS